MPTPHQPHQHLKGGSDKERLGVVTLKVALSFLTILLSSDV